LNIKKRLVIIRKYITESLLLWLDKIYIKQRFVGEGCPEDGGSMVLRNVDILPQHYRMSQPRIPRLKGFFYHSYSFFR